MSIKVAREYRDRFFNGINIKIIDVIIINVVMIVIQFVSNIATYFYLDWSMYAHYNTVVLSAFSIIVIVITIKYRIKNAGFFGIYQAGILKHSIFAIGIVCLFYFVKYGLVHISKNYGLVENINGQYNNSSSILIGITIFVSPLKEEILFRGFYYPALRKIVGIIPGMFFCSIIFLLWHVGLGNTAVLTNIFFTGMFFTYLYERSMSLIPSTISHILINFSSNIPTGLKILGIQYSPSRLSLVMSITYLILFMICLILYKTDHINILNLSKWMYRKT